MTKKELSQLYYLNREVEQLQERCEELRGAVEKVTSIITDMPRGGQRNDLKDELIDLIDLLALKQKQCLIEQSRIERYINNIPDSLTRQIFALRFINGLSWRQVAFSVGGGNTEESVRQLAHRYLKKSQQN